MFSLSSTATLHHVTPLPPGTTFEAAMAVLQDHELLIKLDPEYAHHEDMPSPPDANPKTKCYKVTDHMHTLPKGLWDTTVSFESHITNLDDGVEWNVKAPLGLVQRTTWRIVRSDSIGEGAAHAHGNGKGKEKAADEEESEARGGGEWCLVEEAEIQASRLLLGTVKSKCEGNWRGIHARFIGHLQAVPVHA